MHDVPGSLLPACLGRFRSFWTVERADNGRAMHACKRLYVVWDTLTFAVKTIQHLNALPADVTDRMQMVILEHPLLIVVET
uniref:Uncharacterized protein n=1 Tax=Physcomitrium patens TaxID=3218 RepID=A0A7I4AZ94_PHYPA